DGRLPAQPERGERCVQRQHVRRSCQAKHGGVRGCESGIRRHAEERLEAEHERRRAIEGRACRSAGLGRSADPLTIVAMLLATALALTADATPNVAGSPTASNLEYVQPIAGDWAYFARADGSEATFSNSAGQAQLTIRCTRSTRRISLLKAAASASPTLWVWTSSERMSLPATYDAASARLSADVRAYDPFLDAIAASRGRIGFSSSGLAALVIPPWAEVGRVIEDCRI